MQYILSVSVVIFAASLAQAVTGFGFAIVAAPFLAFIMGPKETVIFLLFSGMFMKSVMLYKTWSAGDSKQVFVLFAGSLLGALPGGYILKIASAGTIKIIIGFGLLLATLFLIKDFKFEIVHKNRAKLACGFFSGLCGATAGLNGPPVVCYYLNEKMPKEAMRANLVRFFLLGNAGTLFLSYVWGSFQPGELINITLTSIPAMLLGWAIGERLFYKINQLLFKRLIVGPVFVSAVVTLASGLLA